MCGPYRNAWIDCVLRWCAGPFLFFVFVVTPTFAVVEDIEILARWPNVDGCTRGWVRVDDLRRVNPGRGGAERNIVPGNTYDVYACPNGDLYTATYIEQNSGPYWYFLAIGVPLWFIFFIGNTAWPIFRDRWGYTQIPEDVPPRNDGGEGGEEEAL